MLCFLPIIAAPIALVGPERAVVPGAARGGAMMRPSPMITKDSPEACPRDRGLQGVPAPERGCSPRALQIELQAGHTVRPGIARLVQGHARGHRARRPGGAQSACGRLCPRAQAGAQDPARPHRPAPHLLRSADEEIAHPTLPVRGAVVNFGRAPAEIHLGTPGAGGGLPFAFPSVAVAVARARHVARVSKTVRL